MSTQPLTVVYVGNFTRPWCTEVHVSKSLELLGHRVVRLQENQTDWRTVVPAVERERASLLLWTRTWDVDHDVCLAALAGLREIGVPSVFFHLDRWFGLDREYQVSTQPFFRLDLVFSPDGGSDDRWQEAGVNHRWMPPGVFGPECHLARATRRPSHEVVFVGSHPYPHAEWEPYRTALIDTLQARYGTRFGVYPRRRQPVRGRALTELYSSAKVVVGDSCLIGNPKKYWSDRIPETLGRGGLLIHPGVEGLGEWYESGRDLLTYPLGDFDEVCRLVDWALANPEDAAAIRRQGQATVLGRDTYEHRMAEVLRIVGDELGFPDRPAQPAPLVVAARSARHRVAARFQLVEGDSDALAVEEVWTNDDYRVTSAQVRNKVVVDIGANVGAFTVLAARLGARRVVAFEPDPDNFAALRANVAANNVAGRVELREQAVMGEAGKVALTGRGGGVHVAEAGTAVEAVAIDDVLAGVGNIALLKIDTEGAEYDMLLGLRDRELLNRVEAMALEFHGPGMPHLSHLNGSGWAPMVEMLANYGRLEIFGRPMVGGLLWWRRF